MKLPFKITLLGSLLLTTYQVQAAATLASEMSKMHVSTSGAGGAAVAENASVAYSNPAGMSYLNERSLSVNLAAMNLSIDYQDTRSDDLSQGDAGGLQPYGSIYYVQPLSDNTRFGISLAATGGSSLDYGTSYAGKLELNSLQLSVMQLNPSLSWQVSDKLSLGAGVQIDYAVFEQSMLLDNVELATDSTALGFNLGVIYQLSNNHRLGLTYRSKMEHDLSGELSSTAGHQASVGLNVLNAGQVELSGLHQVSEPLSLVWSLGFENWSQNNATYIDVNGEQVIEKARQFEDIWTAAAGARYQLTNTLRLEGGIGYASSPLDDPGLQSADLPVAQQIRYSAGVTYDFSKKMSVNAYYSYVDYGSPEIDGAYMQGSYDNSNQFLGMMFNAAF
ncbi:OmpP1/FadL family transporter [Psychromonas aquimarina]|uniref:OmpP1/FadL family transporter n=1 Tax=Psychromonas aquimarina TaxID=444919 RepID=UPI0003F64763|nr:outer membrane protein transport protein [Psychromonas aquimarina]